MSDLFRRRRLPDPEDASASHEQDQLALPQSGVGIPIPPSAENDPQLNTKPSSFIIGDYDTNKIVAERILEQARLTSHVWAVLWPELKESGIQFFASSMTTAITTAISNYVLGPNPGDTSNMIKMQAISSAVGQLTAPLTSLLKSYIFPPSGPDQEVLVFRVAVQKLKAEAQPLLDTLPEPLSRPISKFIDEMMLVLQSFKPGYSFRPDIGRLQTEFDTVIGLLSLPVQKVNTYGHDRNGNKEEAERLDTEQTKLLSTFQEEVKDKLNAFIDRARLYQVRLSGVPPVLVMEGPPAVGKTHLMTNYANAFGSHLMVVTAKEMTEFLGISRDERFRWPPPDTPWLDRVGKIWRTLIKDVKDGNVVMLLDEYDPSEYPELESALKRWLTGEAPIIPASREAPGSPKGLVFAIATNKKLNFDAALESRVTMVKFRDWTHPELTTRAEEFLARQVDEVRIHHQDETAESVEEHGQKFLRFMLAELQKYPDGAVNLRELQKEITKVVDALIVAADKQLPIDHDTLECSVSNEFVKLAEKSGKLTKKPEDNNDADVSFPGEGRVLVEKGESVLEGAPPVSTESVEPGEAFVCAYELRHSIPLEPSRRDTTPNNLPLDLPSDLRPIIEGLYSLSINEFEKEHDCNVTSVNDFKDIKGRLVKANGESLYFKEPGTPLRIVQIPRTSVPATAICRLGKPVTHVNPWLAPIIEDLAGLNEEQIASNGKYNIVTVSADNVADSTRGYLVGVTNGDYYFCEPARKMTPTLYKIPASLVPANLAIEVASALPSTSASTSRDKTKLSLELGKPMSNDFKEMLKQQSSDQSNIASVRRRLR